MLINVAMSQRGGQVIARLVEVTSRKVAVSIPDGYVGIFYWHNPSGRCTTVGSTQPLTEMSTRNISLRGGGGRRPVRRAHNLTTFMCWLSWNLRASTSWNPQVLSWPVQGLLNLNFLMSQHERKTSVPIGRYQITPTFSYVTPTADQNYLHRSLRTIIHIGNRIYCPSRCKRDFPTRPDRPWGPPSLL